MVREGGVGGRWSEGSRIGGPAGRGTAAGRKLIVGGRDSKKPKECEVRVREGRRRRGSTSQVAQALDKQQNGFERVSKRKNKMWQRNGKEREMHKMLVPVDMS